MADTGRGGLWHAVLTLLAGGALAQALPLLLGPVLTRLFTPAEFGLYHLFAAVAANVAVVACGRYELALPMARDEAEAEGLRVLSLRLLAVSKLATVFGAIGWWWGGAGTWVAWLPAAVGVAGWLSLATMWATRAQRFQALAAARVLQYGGAALAQAAAGWAGAGVHGLIVAPIAAAALATLVLRLPLRPLWGLPAGREPLRAVAHRFRDFPLLNTPHAFLGGLQDTLSLALIAAWLGPAEAGFWGLALRYLKAPATLVGSAVSQVLYPRLVEAGAGQAARAQLRQVVALLACVASGLVGLLWAVGPWLFGGLFGSAWAPAGELARALALYIGWHFVAAPLAVVTLAWQAQAWALRLALVGQLLFIGALGLGLWLGGLVDAGWAVSLAMSGYFAYYLWRLTHWPVVEQSRP